MSTDFSSLSLQSGGIVITRVCWLLRSFVLRIGVGAQSTLRGTKFLPEKNVLKISKMPEFYMILARKIIRIPEFL